ncbi:MAG: Fe-S cluster assembly protein SufD [Gammaproteobacteria bacterium]|nr:Fe-S cluster assembly protein SufD [Gammaproteobacteria bacterium]
MKAESGFIEAAIGREAPDSPMWAQDIRESGRKLWRAQSFPTRKTEAWKYLSLRALERGDYTSTPATPPSLDTDALRSIVEIEGLDACRLVFVNGTFVAELSDGDVPDGVTLVRFSEAGDEEAKTISSHLGSVVDKDRHLFAALNDSWLGDGVFLRIEANADVERPIQLVWLTQPDTDAFSISQRLMVVAGDGSRARIIEHFVSTGDEQNAFTNGITEIDIGANAQLDHYRLHLEESHALHIGGVHARLARDSGFRSFHLGMGSTLKRIDAVVHHAGEGAHCEMNGIYLPRGSEQVDYHTTIEHAVANCTTNETFRGIVADKAKAVFNGRIHIHPKAQKSNAQLSNKNLLTSASAEVDTKPELEIYADDVQCAHGATVSQLEEESLYYFLSRGIDREEAQVMLSFGFINELVGRVDLQPLTDYLRDKLSSLFSGSGDLVRRME